MKINTAAVKRLAKVLMRTHKIPTGEKLHGRDIVWIPTNQILRSEKPYADINI